MGDIMEKKSVGNYFLVFEPKYVNYQYSVYFLPSGETVICKIDKYTDVLYGTGKKVKKNTLSDIDRILTGLSNEKEFFDKYIDSSIFCYNRDNLHKIFIGKMRKIADKKYMKCYECIFDLKEMNDKLKFIVGSSVRNEKIIRDKYELISLLTDRNSNFLRFAINVKNDKKIRYLSSVSTNILEIASELQRCNRDISEGRISGTFDDVNVLKSKLDEKLTSYKEYRELFLIRKLYLMSLDNKKEQLLELKSKVLKGDFKKEVYPVYEQISMFPEDNLKVKKKNSNNKG